MAASSGVSRSLTSAVTTAPNAPPMTTATARSITLPRNRNCFSPFSMALEFTPSQAIIGTPPCGGTMVIPNSYEILQAVIDATPDAIFVKDLEGRYVLVNDAMARFLGKSAAEIVGKNDFELYPAATAQRFIEDDRQVLASGVPRAFEGVATVEDGSSQ